ncbi:poly-gamma-glutamate hydrolase family protein [Streptomyces sp. PR69]|uniref:poly-gamma-glutamate hydrolase family protein n=1 Tax=Streptomyces sp. PR69 TaxID=2984950 RepID=UPI00226440B2|nr:poly-gamma-glutamate hydrolase family protein [Streptomyces sp. PR69]
MTSTSRRTLLTAFTAAAVTGPLLGGVAAPPAHAADDLYDSNTDLYTRLAGLEGTDFARRYRRHQHFDDSPGRTYPFNRTTIMALHGGSIEIGTSELCLGIAGYRPDSLTPLQDGHGVHDYWMFEGLKNGGNSVLHVTSTHNDDHVAVSMAASSLNVLSLHGCSTASAGASGVVVVGGRNERFKTLLKREFSAAGIGWRDGSEVPHLAGVSTANLCNRTMLGKGAQLEITSDLRAAMFRVNTRAGRAGSTKDEFDAFVGACRRAIATLEADPDQVIL